MKKRVRNYRMNLPDGIDHHLTIRDEDDDAYTVESVHSFSGYAVVAEGAFNKCLFEELLRLGIITPL